MVLRSDPQLDTIFQALADPTRRAMLRSLAAHERSLSELASPFVMSFPAASKHVRVLEGAGLVTRRVEGRTHICALNAEPLAAATDWLSFYQTYWSDKFDRLDAILTAEPEEK
ncbi:ArsR/SmtB family transcription factor [Pelagibacterium luteolum]|uniref:DNA-binding transcriptional regulator, ArsR family n=1 Tax=Pelagibacterium luteolum TaxID=440168 RepID=A0A1G7WDS3_9HYPH|nr:metalloregulator ArsR/SmtB family transcription factor [Pelagibacterium luteolum]SDG70088.1 DNA-binding transcriptional regulator, ArsR family [Pelagibacterium luteolum]